MGKLLLVLLPNCRAEAQFWRLCKKILMNETMARKTITSGKIRELLSDAKKVFNFDMCTFS